MFRPSRKEETRVAEPGQAVGIAPAIEDAIDGLGPRQDVALGYRHRGAPQAAPIEESGPGAQIAAPQRAAAGRIAKAGRRVVRGAIGEVARKLVGAAGQS
jgi:hypothetical protein